MNIRNKKGISLIVLVITIIVIIVLAVAVILSLANNNPIENARKARFQSDLKTIQEEVSLYVGKEYVETEGKYNINDCTFSGDNMLDKFKIIPEDYKNKIEIVDGKVVLVGDNTGDTEQEWAEEIGVKLLSYEPTIPVGFKYLEGTVDTGYVIQNETDGNEFVWVPVDDIKKFVVEEGYSYAKTPILQDLVSSGKITEPLDYDGVKASQSEIDEYNNMMDSIKRYHGFYIGRNLYGSDTSGGAAVVDVWAESMTNLSGGAVASARAIYSNSDKTLGSKYAVSTLPYGVQWDQIVRWLEKNYPGISKEGTIGEEISDSSNNRIKHLKTNNIFDFGYYLFEWTMEACSTDKRVLRGRDCGWTCGSGSNTPMSFRFAAEPNTSHGSLNIGFRVALYVK